VVVLRRRLGLVAQGRGLQRAARIVAIDAKFTGGGADPALVASPAANLRELRRFLSVRLDRLDPLGDALVAETADATSPVSRLRGCARNQAGASRFSMRRTAAMSIIASEVCTRYS
jgi:hypothetical protein